MVCCSGPCSGCNACSSTLTSKDEGVCADAKTDRAAYCGDPFSWVNRTSHGRATGRKRRGKRDQEDAGRWRKPVVAGEPIHVEVTAVTEPPSDRSLCRRTRTSKPHSEDLRTALAVVISRDYASVNSSERTQQFTRHLPRPRNPHLGHRRMHKHFASENQSPRRCCRRFERWRPVGQRRLGA